MPTFEPEPGVTIRYDARGSGRPAVLVHGWSMSSRAFAWQADALVEAGYRVLAPDLRGHGGSSAAPAHEVADHARDLAALFATEDVAGAALVGWSMGGQVALEALPALGERVGALALLSATPRFAACEGWPHGLPEVSVRALAAKLEYRPEKTLQRFFEGMFVPDELDDDGRARVGERVLAGALPRDVAAARAGLDALLQADQRARLADVRAPLLLVHGERDPICLPAASAWMHAEVPGSRLATLPGLGHAPQLSRPERVSELLVGFLAEALA
jgi:pimeloyl-[acyl-carrier protein] methyl ester esterase